MGLVTLAAFALLFRPAKVIAEPDTQIGGGTDLTRTLKLDNKSAEWDAIVEKLSIQRQVQEERKLEEERIAAEAARKKAEAEAIAAKAKAVEAATQQKATVPTAEVSGSKADWLKASGIPSELWSYVDYIVTRESGWNPNAVNKSGGACGLGQQLPCGKWAGAWNDPVAALKAMNSYVLKYGGWVGAVAFWQSHNWY